MDQKPGVESFHEMRNIRNRTYLITFMDKNGRKNKQLDIIKIYALIKISLNLRKSISLYWQIENSKITLWGHTKNETNNYTSSKFQELT